MRSWVKINEEYLVTIYRRHDCCFNLQKITRNRPSVIQQVQKDKQNIASQNIKLALWLNFLSNQQIQILFYCIIYHLIWKECFIKEEGFVFVQPCAQWTHILASEVTTNNCLTLPVYKLFSVGGEKGTSWSNISQWRVMSRAVFEHIGQVYL